MFHGHPRAYMGLHEQQPVVMEVCYVENNVLPIAETHQPQHSQPPQIPMMPIVQSQPSSSIVEEPDLDGSDNEAGTSKGGKNIRDGKIRRFRKEWLEEEGFKDWLAPVEGDKLKCKCIRCDIVMNCRRPDLIRHSKTLKHTRNTDGEYIPRNPSVSNLPNLSPPNTPTLDFRAPRFEPPEPPPKPPEPHPLEETKNEKVREAELMLAAYFAKHNIPYSLLEHLVVILQNAFFDSKISKDIKMKPPKCIQLIKEILAKVECNEMVDRLKRVPFSILVDECLDANYYKFLCVKVRYVSLMGFLKTELLDVVPLDKPGLKVNGEALYSAFRECLRVRNIPLKNVIGCAADGDEKMIGPKDSFMSHLEEYIPDVIFMQYLNHSPFLVASKACEKLPDEPEELLRNIATYTSRSSRYCKELLDLQHFMHEERKKAGLLKESYLKWLSVHSCVLKILEKWDSLKGYFQTAIIEDSLKQADDVYLEMNNPFSKSYLLFLKYALTYFNSLHTLYQSNKILLQALSDNSRRMYNMICQNFIKPTVLNKFDFDVMNPENILPLGDVYLGPECERRLEGLPAHEVYTLRTRCLEFYVSCATELKKRLPLTEIMFQEMKFLDPDIALYSKKRIDVGEPVHLGMFFKDYLNTRLLQREWISLPHCFSEEQKQKLKAMEIDQMWHEIANAVDTSRKYQFPNIGKLAKLALTFPHCSGRTQHILSVVNQLRFNKQDRLADDAFTAIALLQGNAFPKWNGPLEVSQSHLDNFTVENLMKGGHITEEDY